MRKNLKSPESLGREWEEEAGGKEQLRTEQLSATGLTIGASRWWLAWRNMHNRGGVHRTLNFRGKGHLCRNSYSHRKIHEADSVALEPCLMVEVIWNCHKDLSSQSCQRQGLSRSFHVIRSSWGCWFRMMPPGKCGPGNLWYPQPDPHCLSLMTMREMSFGSSCFRHGFPQ